VTRDRREEGRRRRSEKDADGRGMGIEKERMEG